MDVELKIRHGKSLLLRNAIWKITKQETSDILLGRPTLDALGLKTKEILAAACDRFNGTIDISKALSSSTTDKNYGYVCGKDCL